MAEMKDLCEILLLLGMRRASKQLFSAAEGNWVESDEGYAYFPIDTTLVRSVMGEFALDVPDDVELNLICFKKRMPAHRHLHSDGAILWKHVGEHRPSSWGMALGHADGKDWKIDEPYAEEVTAMPRGTWHDFSPGGSTFLYGITANSPPLDDADIEYMPQST